MTNIPESLSELCDASAKDLAAAFASRDVSPVEVAVACLARAESINAAFNAFTVIDHEGALMAAKAAEIRWARGQPLSAIDGIPITIKDLIACKGLDVRYGSLSASDTAATCDAPAVQRLRDSGGVILGLTTTPEFGWKAVTDSPRNGISRNPWDASRTPGGSSGGAGIAAATGAGALHLGTDGGGSIRIPASFCGVVGHKPTFGRVPAHPASTFGTLAHVAPMGRTVGDVILMLDSLSGRSLRDWSQPPMTAEGICVAPFDWKGVKIGYWDTPCVGTVDPEVDVIVRSTVNALALAGAIVEPIRLPGQDSLLDMFYGHWHVGAAARLAGIDEHALARCDPGLRVIAALGRGLSAVDHVKVQVARAQYGAQMDALLARYDLVVSPTVAIAPFEAGADVPAGLDYKSWIEWASFTFPVNLSQQPACSVPCGRTALGLPVGLQIIGARGADEHVLSAALAYEELFTERFLSRGAAWPVRPLISAR